MATIRHSADLVVNRSAGSMDAPQDHKKWWDVWGQAASAVTSIVGLATALLGLWKAGTEAQKREKKLHLKRKRSRFVRCVLRLVGRGGD